MRKAVQVDDEQFFKVQERLAQLEVRTEPVAEDKSSFGGSLDFFWILCLCQGLNNTKNLRMG